MLIKYQPKQDHIKCVPLVPINAEQRKIRLTRSQVQLLPGTNEVTDDEWDVMKAHLAAEIARGEILTIERDLAKSKKNPNGGKACNLKDMPVQEAIALVTACVNPDTLTKWYKEEVRDEVRLNIVEKMKELKMDLPKFIPGSVEDDENDPEKTGDGSKALGDMTIDELKAYATEKGITVSGNKAEIIEAIKEAEAN